MRVEEQVGQRARGINHRCAAKSRRASAAATRDPDVRYWHDATMTSKPAPKTAPKNKKTTKRPAVPIPGTMRDSDLGIALESLAQETERGSALVGGALLEELLKEVIAAHMVPGVADPLIERAFDHNGFAGTFSRCICVAICFGVVPLELAGALDLVRDIRNGAAHFSRLNGSPFSFDVDDIRDRLNACPMVRRLPTTRQKFECLVTDCVRQLLHDVGDGAYLRRRSSPNPIEWVRLRYPAREVVPHPPRITATRGAPRTLQDSSSPARPSRHKRG